MKTGHIVLTISLIAVALALFAINPQTDTITQNLSTGESNAINLDCGLTDDFISFLNDNGYKNWNFNRTQIPCAAYGGKMSPDQKTKGIIPIIMIHGNNDVAYGRGQIDQRMAWQTGYRELIAFYAKQHKFQKNRMYTTTWGVGDALAVPNNYYSKDAVLRTRAFIEAVLNYTGAKQVHIVAHDMGVAVARRAVKGGRANDHILGYYQVGTTLKDKVATFIGIAGINYGIIQCLAGRILTSCNTQDGLWPGGSSVAGPSHFLAQLNTDSQTQSSHVYVIYTTSDEIILNNCIAWGKVTCRIPGQLDQIKKTTSDWGHFDIRDKMGPQIFNWQNPQ